MTEETKNTDVSGQDGEKAVQEQKVVDFGAAVSHSDQGNIFTLTIIGQIEGHQALPETQKTTKYEHIMPLLANLEQMGLNQILITDPLSILYLTGRLIKPLERFYALYLNRSGNHKIFINLLETVPEDLGVEKVRFSDTDPYLDLAAAAGGDAALHMQIFHVGLGGEIAE